MDITLVRQAKQKSESVDGKEIKFLDISGIFDLSKSALRILYECGKRPLYAFLNSKSNEPEISVVPFPQDNPGYILCNKERNSFQSAMALKRQMSYGGIDLPIARLAELSDFSSKPAQKRLSNRLIKEKLQSLERSGCKHVIIVADEKRLNDIYRMITQENLPEIDEDYTCLWGIRNNQLSYIYNSQRVDYVTEGMLDTKLVTQINAPDCPKRLKIFQGKVKKPIDEYKLFYDFKQIKKS